MLLLFVFPQKILFSFTKIYPPQFKDSFLRQKAWKKVTVQDLYHSTKNMLKKSNSQKTPYEHSMKKLMLYKLIVATSSRCTREVLVLKLI